MIIFIPDRAVYEIRRIRLRREYLDGRYQETIYDYTPSKVTALTTCEGRDPTSILSD